MSCIADNMDGNMVRIPTFKRRQRREWTVCKGRLTVSYTIESRIREYVILVPVCQSTSLLKESRGQLLREGSVMCILHVDEIVYLYTLSEFVSSIVHKSSDSYIPLHKHLGGRILLPWLVVATNALSFA